MIENKLNSLFEAITSSKEYQAYLNIGNVTRNNKEICDLVDEIKMLQQKSVELEYAGDLTYKEIDKEIEEKVNTLNANPVYCEYLRRMEDFNDVISQSSSTIEKFINSKI